jgi:hypothetical protein
MSRTTSGKTTATSSVPTHETVDILKYFEEIGILKSENADEFLCKALVGAGKCRGIPSIPYLFKDLSRTLSKNSPKIPSSLFLFSYLIFPVC